jgi:uncharacterized protein
MIDILNKEQVEEILSRNVLGRIGCTDGEKVYVVPVNYAYDGRCIICHSTEGMKIQMMRKHPQVCFEVDEMQDYTKWKSVIAWGEFQELTGQSGRYNAMKLFVDRMMHIKISKTANPAAHGNSSGSLKAVIYRIVLQEKTGRFENE